MNIRVNTAEELYSAILAEGIEEIVVEEGVYEIDKTLKIKSGTKLRGDGDVVFKGTKRVSVDCAEYADGIYVLDLNKEGISDTGKFGEGPYNDFWREYDIPKPHMTEFGPSLEVYSDNKKMNMTRYPKDGFIKIEKALGKTRVDREGGTRSGTVEGVFIPEETEVFDRNDTDEMLLVGYWSLDWATQRHLIKNYNKETKVVEVTEPYHEYYYIDENTHDKDNVGRFYILNLLSEVKEPGDWCINRKEGKLYFIPFEGQQYLDISVCENLFEAENKEDISIENVSVLGCRKSAFYFNKCKNVSVSGCKMYNVGAWGAILDWCTESQVSDCEVYNTGGGGIACSGGDRATLTSSKNRVMRNTIHNIAYWHRTYLAGIEINGVNVVVSENRIYDVPHFAIAFHGNEHIMEKNHIRNACYESNDAGAIYAGRDYTCRGTIIRYNCIQDLMGYNGEGCLGIYFDDGMCSAEVYGNILTNMTGLAILVGGGRNFDIHDNIFYNCTRSFMIDDRLESWPFGNAGVAKHLADVPYRSEIWEKAYPYLYKILDDEPTLPKYNKFYRNTVIGGIGITLTDKYIDDLLERYDNTYVEVSDNEKAYKNLPKHWLYYTTEM